MTSGRLTSRQAAVLRAAPIGVEHDDGNGDPHRPVRFRYHGVDGRVAAGLWSRGLLKLEQAGPNRGDGFLLKLTDAGRAALARPDPTLTAVE